MAASQLVSPPKVSGVHVVSVLADIGCTTVAVFENVMTAPCAWTPPELTLLNICLAPFSAPSTWFIAPACAMLPDTSTTKITLTPQLGEISGGWLTGVKPSFFRVMQLLLLSALLSVPAPWSTATVAQLVHGPSPDAVAVTVMVPMSSFGETGPLPV